MLSEPRRGYHSAVEPEQDQTAIEQVQQSEPVNLRRRRGCQQ